jgi:hypothetical protein
MINIVETYFKLSRSMIPDRYIDLLKNSVYSSTKATELKETLDVLGFNWMTLKEQIKTVKLA